MTDIFITENFLLQNDRAAELYHRYARDLPIIDYHCHLPPRRDRRGPPLREPDADLAGTATTTSGGRCGRPACRNAICTGDASDREKFQKWAETVPQTLRNPLYHWTHLELKRPLGISDRLLGPDTAEGIWQECNAKLARPEFSCRGIMRQMNVALVCTTDDPTDTLEHHRAIAADASFPIRVLPTFRPDRAMAVESPAAFNAWVDRLAAAERRRRGRRFRPLSRRPAAAARFLPRAGLPPFRPRRWTRSTPTTTRRPKWRRAFARVRSGKPLGRRRDREVQVGHALRIGRDGPRKGLDAAVPFRRTAEQQHADVPALGPDTGFDSIGDWPAGPADGAVPRPARPRRPAGQDDPLQPQPGRQRSGGHDDRATSRTAHARQDAVRQRLVVPRSEGRHGAATRTRCRTWGC